MKKIFKTLITAAFLLAFTKADAHYLDLKGWCGGSYTIFARLGTSGGSIKVTVYTTNPNSGGVVIPQTGGTPPNYTITYPLSNAGSNNGGWSRTFTVPQTNRNASVYVKVDWYNSNGTIDNSSVDKSITTNNSLLSGCTTLAIKTLEIIDAKNVDNTTVIQFKAESDSNNEILVINYIMPDQTVRSIKVLFWTMLKPEDTWEIIINNITNKVISVKNKK